MNASELTFGVEIETTIPYGACNVGPHGSGLQVPWLPQGWLADADPSIRARRGRQGCEFVSPILKGADGIRELIAAVEKIKAMGATVNASGGMHVHVGFDRNDAKGRERLITLVANFEKAIYAVTGTKKRERGIWCRGLQRLGNVRTVEQHGMHQRYHVLNLSNILSGRRAKPTVEFRAFGATLNVVKVVGYVRLCLGLVERALKAKRVTNFTAKAPVESSPIHRKGEGQTALTRLFYQLGWIKGRSKYCYGDETGAGATPPSHRETKRELMRLAKKYDSDNTPPRGFEAL
jgi:hypothetical protein